MELDYPNGLFYYDDFVDDKTAMELKDFIDGEPWDKSLSRRVQHYGHRYSYKYAQMKDDYVVKPVPDIFLSIFKKIKEINHIITCDQNNLQVIVNEYNPGQGISAHTDDTNQFGEWVVGVSLLSPVEMEFSKSSKVIEVLLKPNSLYIMTGESLYQWKHEIKPKLYNNDSKRDRRISLTFRYKRQK